MVTWLKDFWNDKAGFERIARAMLVAGALFAQSQGWISGELASAIAGGSLLIAAGDKNPKGAP